MKTDFDMTVDVIQDSYPGLHEKNIINMLNLVKPYLKELHKLYTNKCNRVLYRHEEFRIDEIEMIINYMIKDCLYGLAYYKIEFNEDARGNPVRLHLLSKRSNNMGGEGWDLPY